MSFLVSIQQVHDDGAIGPLPGERGVIEVECDELGEMGDAIANTLGRFPDVRDFDLTITNREIPLA